jgi:hypothetical protein
MAVNMQRWGHRRSYIEDTLVPTVHTVVSYGTVLCYLSLCTVCNLDHHSFILLLGSLLWCGILSTWYRTYSCTVSSCSVSSWCSHLLLFIKYFWLLCIVLCNLRIGKPVILFPLNNILLLPNNYSAIPLSSVTDPIISLLFRIPLFNSIRIWILLYKKVI